MSKSQETWNKKETEKKKQQKKKEKEQRKQDRKDNPKSSNMEDMMAYVDEYGNITSTPPDPKKKKIEINEADIVIGVARQVAEESDALRKGIVTFFNESKGYGFIKDSQTQESIFVHVNGLEDPIKENNKVTFETETSPKGLNAIKVKLAK